MIKKKQQNKRAAENGIKICFVAKRSFPREEMLRFVVSPQGEVIFDVYEKLPGAGIWLYPKNGSLEKAIVKNLFCKAAGGMVQVPFDLQNQVLIALKKKVLDLLGLARKAGRLVFGYESVKKALENHEIGVVFEANDSSERGKNKLYLPSDRFLICGYFSRDELGQITGQDVQVHVAVLKSKIAIEIEQIALKIDLLLGREKKG